MIYLKSVAGGLVALVTAAIATALVIVANLVIKGRNLAPGQTYQWDPVSFFRTSLVSWLFFVVAFLIGFALEYRRVIVHP